MLFRCVVLDAGMQGTAAANDLARFGLLRGREGECAVHYHRRSLERKEAEVFPW